MPLASIRYKDDDKMLNVADDVEKVLCGRSTSSEDEMESSQYQKISIPERK